MAKYKHKKSKMIIDAVPYTNGQEDGFMDGKPYIYATLGKMRMELLILLLKMLVFMKKSR